MDKEELPPGFEKIVDCFVESSQDTQGNYSKNTFGTDGLRIYKKVNGCYLVTSENIYQDTIRRLETNQNGYASYRWVHAGTMTVLDVRDILEQRKKRFQHIMTYVPYCIGHQEVYDYLQTRQCIQNILTGHAKKLQGEIENELVLKKYDTCLCHVQMNHFITNMEDQLASRLLPVQNLYLKNHPLYRAITMLIWEYCDFEYITFVLEPPIRSSWTETRTNYYYGSHGN